MLIYANDNADGLPGVNTTGLVTRAKIGVAGALNPRTVPVQSYDWMTPLLQDDADLPGNRAARFHYVYSQYQCPEQTRTAILYTLGLNNSPDRADFAQYPTWPACSYLMPAYFSLWGRSYAQTILTYTETSPALPIRARTILSSWEVQNDTYSSHLSQVGPASRKVFAADGTRYMDAFNVIDIDVNPDSSWYGAFSSLGAWWCGSTEYGVKTGSLNWNGRPISPGSPSQGLNLPVSYRHGPPSWGEQAASSGAVRLDGPEAGDGELSGAGMQIAQNGTAQGNTGYINAIFFDGHVETLSDRQSREISLWYPTGSTVQVSAQGMTDVPNGTVIP